MKREVKIRGVSLAIERDPKERRWRSWILSFVSGYTDGELYRCAKTRAELLKQLDRAIWYDLAQGEDE
jgi:hypothetical protein